MVLLHSRRDDRFVLLILVLTLRGVGGQQILDWLVQLVCAIDHLHSLRILHRDLKTSNVFLTKNNIVKLGDFGIARVLDYTMDQAKTVVGTPFYMYGVPPSRPGGWLSVERDRLALCVPVRRRRSPEVCQRRPYSFKSDMWALGCILYELCSLQRPFSASNIFLLACKIVTVRPGDSQSAREGT